MSSHQNLIVHALRHPRIITDGSNLCYGHLDFSPCPLHLNELIGHYKYFAPPNSPIYSSPLQRCLLLARGLSKNIIIDKRLTEMNFGHWEGKLWDEIPRDCLDEWAKNIEHFCIPGGESYQDVVQRISFFIKDHAHEREIFLITHAGIIRTLMIISGNESLKEVFRKKIDYGSYFRFEIASLNFL